MKSINVSTLEKLAAYLQGHNLILKSGCSSSAVEVLRRVRGDNDSGEQAWWARLSDGAVVVSYATGATLLQAIERAIAAYEVQQ